MYEDIIKVFSGLLAPLIACLAVYIAWQQHKTARYKLMLDLFERRMAVFSEIKSLLNAAFQEGELSTGRLLQFRTATYDAEFIFGKNVANYIKTIRLHGGNLLEANQTLKAAIDEEQRATAASRITAELSWLGDQYDISKSVFRPYFNFSSFRFR